MNVTVFDLVVVTIISVLAFEGRRLHGDRVGLFVVAGVSIMVAVVSLLFPQPLKDILQLVATAYLLIASVIEYAILTRRHRAHQAAEFDRRLHDAITDVTDINLVIWHTGSTAELMDRSTRAFDHLRAIEAPTKDWAALRDSYVPPLIRARDLSIAQEPVESFAEMSPEMEAIVARRRALLGREP